MKAKTLTLIPPITLLSLLWVPLTLHAANEDGELSLPQITVMGLSGAGRSSVQDFIPTLSELSGRKLDKKRQSTLGETLAHETGVSSTQFGPGSSRPVVRALDGDRIRILQGGIGTLDASGTSADHAVAGDPLLIDRVEVIRGSAALLYGSSAIGGVVNTTSSRIPNRLQYDSKVKLDSRVSSSDQGKSLGLLINQSSGPWAYHLDGVTRSSNNYLTPGGRVANSAAETLDGAIGLSHIGASGYFGAALSSFNTDYGVVKEQDVVIELNRKRLDFAGEFSAPGWIESGRVAGALSYYKHQELEQTSSNVPETGTVFRNSGGEIRADLKHRPMGAFQGILGTQAQLFHFSATGEEAFLPTTDNANLAVFAFEELPSGDWTPSLGARAEWASSQSQASDVFGASEKRSFVTPSLSVGTLYRLDSQYSLGLNTSFTERAPNYQELFASGAHMATGTYEIGDLNLKREIGRSLEFSIRRKSPSPTASSEGRLTFFVQDFTRFIALTPNGVLNDLGTPGDPDDDLPEYEFRPVSAILYGAEFEHRAQLPLSLWDGVWELELRADLVRGRNRSDQTPLPRITPMRETVGLNFRNNRLSADMDLTRSEAQNELAPNETATPAYHLLNLGAEIPVSTGFGAIKLSARIQNLLDSTARNHVSFVKDVAPLAGRNFIIGVQARL